MSESIRSFAALGGFGHWFSIGAYRVAQEPNLGFRGGLGLGLSRITPIRVHIKEPLPRTLVGSANIHAAERGGAQGFWSGLKV